MLLSTITPNNYFMPFEAVKCWMKARNYPFVYCQGPDLDYNRNEIWRRAVEYGDHLLMIDSDIIFTLEDILKIQGHLENGKDAVTGIYPIGKEPYQPCIFERVEGDYVLTRPKEGLFQIDACGGGFLAIHRKLLKEMPKDPFDNIREGDIFHGEDISFCHRMGEKGFKLWCDSSINLGHVRIDIKKI